MNYRKIIPISILTFCGIVFAILRIISSSLLSILAILLPLVILGAIAIIIATKFGQGKKIYRITGAVIAWVIFFLVWLIWNPETFSFAVHTGAFWILQAFLVINLALLGRTGMMVVFVQIITILVILFSLSSLIANFVEGGPELIARAHNSLARTNISAYITRIKTLDKGKRAEPLLEKLKYLEKKTKKGPLSQADKKTLQQIKEESKRIYQVKDGLKKDKKQKKSPRHLSGIMRIPGGATAGYDVDGKDFLFKLREKVILDVLDGDYKNLLFVNKNIPSERIEKKRTVFVGVPPGKINQLRLMNTGNKTITVQVRIIPRRT